MAEESLRDVIEGSLERAESETTQETTEKPVVDSQATERPGEVAKPAPVETEEKEEVEEKEPAKPKVETAEKIRAETVPKQPESARPVTRAPGTWTVAAREKWAELPPEIQTEVLRREKDIANGFHEVGRIRQFGQDMQNVWSPYQAIIAAEGGDALGMTRNLFATAAALYHGTPIQKAGTVAQMIRTFGIDIGTLDSILAGEAPVVGTQNNGNGVAPQVNAMVQQALAPFYQSQQAQAQAAEREINSEIEAFASDPKNEFFDDVKDIMADYMDLAAAQNKPLDLQTAYNRAILAHDDIAKVVQERATKQSAAVKSTAAAAARKRNVSVTGAPARDLGGVSEGSSLRSDIESAVASFES